MNIFMDELPEDALKLLRELSNEEFWQKLKALPVDKVLKETRGEILFKILKSQKKVDYITGLDIQRYALKLLFPETYVALSLGRHSFSSPELYEYDPPKNGQNIIKHGVSFGEVVSYSSQFGTLIVPCPDDTDDTRCVIFSDLNSGDNGENLSIPFSNINGMIYTLSVVQQRGEKFRFISSRIISPRNSHKIMKQSFKNIYKNDPKMKEVFVKRCVEIAERDLFKTPIQQENETSLK